MAGWRVPIGVAIVAFSVAAADVVSGQTTFGMIAGRVTDSTGAVLPGATVTVLNIRTGDKRVVVTNEQGLYRAPNLSPSTYEIRVELQGFRTVVRQGVAVSVSETLDIAFRLDLESVAETLTVKGESPLISTQSPEIGQKVEAERVLDLPVNSRDFSRLALLAPGAKVNTSGVASLAFNGGDIAQNNFLLDGTDVTHIDNSFMSNGRERGARLQTASSESVEEFRVLTSNYSAEYGRAAAAVVTAITKSGTNAFKGSGYFFYRDDALNTRNFFETDKAPFSLKQFGASLGGPIQRDRLFFFTNYEGSRKHLGATQTGTVPSAQFRATVAPALSNILSTIPLPSQPTSNPNVGIATVSGVTDITENIYSLRMDFRASDKDMVFGRFNIQRSLVDGPLFVLTSSMFAGQRQHAPIVSGSGTVSYTRTLRSNLMNEAKLGINRVHLILNQLDPNFPNPATLKTPDAESYPQTRITGVDVVAGQIQDIDRMNFGYELIDNVTWYSGRHTVKTGVNVRRKETHPFQAGFPTMNYASLADFAANKVQTATAAGDGGPGVVYGWEYSGYVQDNIKPTDRLTLNLGLRYDYGTPFNAAEGTTLANFDLKTLTLVTDAPFYKSDRNNFAPRVSATYDLQGNGRTVIGGGYGIYYNPYALQSFFGGTLFSNVQPSATFNQTTNPGLSYPLPPITGGVVPPPNRTAINPDRVDNYAHQVTANVQREIGTNMSVQIGYVGTRTENDMNPKPGNLIDPALGRRPLPQFGQFTVNTETGHSTYNAVQFLLNRRLSKGVAFNTTYTYSRYRDNKYSQSVTGPEVPCANDRDFATCAGIDNEWGPADLDTPHNFNFNAIWQLPLGNGRLREGWQLNGILLARSGLPYTVFLGTSRAGTGWFTNQRPNVVSGADHEGNIDGPTGWLNPAAFTDVPAGQYGNLGRNTERGPHFIQLDMSLFKNIPLQGSHRIQLRVEVFNVPNNPIWAASPSSTWLTQSSFGRILNTFGRTESFGTSRQIQLAVRYDF